MIKVIIYVDSNDNTVGFKLNGHAQYDYSGKDIVCAAASILTINTINSIENFTDDDISYDAGEKKAEIGFRMTGKISEKSKVLLDAWRMGMEMMESNYSKNITITFKEV